MSIIRVLLAFGVTLLALLLAVPVFVLGLPFWGVAFLTRRIAHQLEPRFVLWQQIIEFDPTIGWKPRPNLATFYLAERDDVYHLITDSQGWPGKLSPAESQVVVFGDSFAFGYGIDAARSYREINPQVRIKAIAAPGYNLVQQLLLMRQLAPELRGKLVVCFIYFGNDLYDNLSPLMAGYRTPFVREARGGAGWEIVTSHLSPRPWQYSTGRARIWEHVLVSLYSPTFLAGRAYSACAFLLEEARAACVRAGAQLVVLTIPSPFSLSQAALARLSKHSESPRLVDADFPDEKLSEICRSLEIPFVIGKRFLGVRDYKRHDDHWNARGHRLVAQLLSRLHQDYAAGRFHSFDVAASGLERTVVELTHG